MPNEYVYALNRNLLGPAGVALSDEDYVRVVAALGIPESESKLLDMGGDWQVTWSVRRFRDSRRRLRKVPPETLVSRWTDLLKDHGTSRIRVSAADRWGDQPDPLAVLGALSHPAVGVASVRLEWSCRQADLKWQWPLRVAAFPEDFAAMGLEHLADSDHWPANRLTRPMALGRDVPRADVLVIQAEARAALARILSLSHRVRASLILLVAPLDVPWQAQRALIDALLAETQAGGLAVVQKRPDESLVDTINHLIEVLSHATPLDYAFGSVFGAGRSMLVLDDRLIGAAQLPAAALAIANRLENMSASMTHSLPQGGAKRVQAEWKRSALPADFARDFRAYVSQNGISFGSESAGASEIAGLEIETQGVERALAAEEAPRFLQGDVYRVLDGEFVPETRGLVQNARHALDVFIGEAGLGALQTDVAVPDEEINWAGPDSVSLQVMLAEPNQWDEPLRGTLQLPRYGRSSTERFVFTPSKPGPFQGRVTLYYRGRVLQTALLETDVVASPIELKKRPEGTDGMRFSVEAALRRSLGTVGERRRFDACIVCNHTATRQAALTAAGKDGAYISSLDNLDTPIGKINSLLTQVANDADRYRQGLTHKDNAELLGLLAIEGHALYRRIVLDYIDRSTAARSIRDADYLQIVTMEPEAIVPLEFVYDFPVPKDGAEVCRHAAKALEEGSCPGSCRPRSGPADRVCPLGFWGLRKVIERHIHVPELTKAGKVVATEPLAGRDTLSLKGATLVGISQEVTAPNDTDLIKTLKEIRKGNVRRVQTWQAWTKAVQEDKPVMLVVLPHTDGSQSDITLEISGDTQKSIHIDQSYVHPESTPAPLTVLLGCDTVNTADTTAYLTHVGVFRQADAALVLATIATVFGEHAADMAERLIACIDASIRAKPQRFGEALLEAKRAAVARSEMIGLCLVAFGDADWQLTAGEE